jgi:aminoglycoside phosphotransferase (APT) family kinase protein
VVTCRRLETQTTAQSKITEKAAVPLGSPAMAETVPGADPGVVGPYLARALDDERWQGCEVVLIAGGKSNLTYRVDCPAGSVVLRRPPLGHVLPTAHDMVREHTVLSALGGTDVPVPRTLHLCIDADVLGQPFYVMEHVVGHVCREDLPPGYADAPAQRRAVGEGLVEVLARLHEVRPDDVGLSGFGRPEGYLERQVRRWLKQWDATRLDGHQALDALGADLAAAVPATQRSAVVHGDYRLDNTILDPTAPGRIAAVLDWEMSTLGDPLADLGILLGYWSQSDDAGARTEALVVPAATVLEGFPTRAEVAELYARRTGLDLAPLPWYVSFAAFKLAVVCAGIVARVRGGAMVGDGFDGIEQRVGPLVEIGREALSGGL